MKKILLLAFAVGFFCIGCTDDERKAARYVYNAVNDQSMSLSVDAYGQKEQHLKLDYYPLNNNLIDIGDYIRFEVSIRDGIVK